MRRRDVISGAAVLAASAAGTAAISAPSPDATHGPTVSAAQFGTVGDGVADDTRALQSALDATLGAGKPGLLLIPPGTYKVSRTLRVEFEAGRSGKVTRRLGLSAQGAQIRSVIRDGSDVLSINSETLVRYLLIDGLDIRGTGGEGHGLSLFCDGQGRYIYNMALRDVMVEGCGGDGCRMIGNIFESQIFNSYFRDNRNNGMTLAHGTHGGVLSAIHIFGCVFGGNKHHGVVMTKGASDVSFHGCYFLQNDQFGLLAQNGCPLLAHCGFENNHMNAKGFSLGGAGLKLNLFGTLIGCTAYSIHNQTHLVDAVVKNRLVMIGCTGSGGGDAKGAKLARLKGTDAAEITLIGCFGGVDDEEGTQPLEIGQRGGARFGSQWNARNLLRMGDHSLWIDSKGRLRMKRGDPSSETDGSAIGG